jgi:hypothetical protein
MSDHKKKESVGERIFDGILLIIWSAIPAMGAMGIMKVVGAPLWAGIGMALIMFPIFGIFDRVNEINNRLKKNEEEKK